ncbi:SDR family oxidoreductase [Kribbella sp. CA-247076]|uniref:SDR family oxidoreductase n=1 Tax=Kribbella sp. CA-247076 TaxID=3239941 RepID=UPI003D8FFAAD
MILVVGATGQLGGLITRILLDRAEPVRVLVRTGSPYDGDAAVEVVTGDLKDLDSLRKACSGVEAVVTTANATDRGGADTIESVDLAGNANLIAAAEAEGVRRFVFVSALGADPQHPMPLLRAKGETERRLRDSGMTWTVLQPNLFMDKLPLAVIGPALAGDPVTLVGEGRRRHSLVAMRDVAEYAVAALHREEAEGQTLVIGGPEPVSWRDVVAAFEHELGREITVRTVPPGRPVPGLSDLVAGLLASLETYDSLIDSSHLSDQYGIRPTTLATFAHDVVTASPHRP